MSQPASAGVFRPVPNGARARRFSALLLLLLLHAACAPQASTNGDLISESAPRAPIADFTASVTRGSAPLTVQFNDTSDPPATSWAWDFDNDGFVDSTEQNPSWTFGANGSFSVELVATNAEGSGSLLRNNLVFVATPPNPQLNMVPIEPGVFLMGSNAGASDEQPVRAVTLSAPFWIGRFEVTQAQYQAVMGTNPSYFQGINAPNAQQRPVEQVSWNGAVAYCQALTGIEQVVGRVPAGYQYRLPTEAEWEYCCRAGTTTEWHTGTSLGTSQANFEAALANGVYFDGQSAVVGSYAPNGFGLHDMHGNVWEWCLDTYSNYPVGPATDPLETSFLDRVFRGGGWSSNFTASNCRSSKRGALQPNFINGRSGFRVVLAPIRTP